MGETEKEQKGRERGDSRNIEEKGKREEEKKREG